MKKIIVAILTLLVIAPNAWAGKGDITIPFDGTFAQSEFEGLSQQLGLAIANRQVAPAEPLGLIGFDAGVEMTFAKIDTDKSFWTKTAGDMPSSIPVPRLRVQKGLPFGIDIGASLTSIPDSDIELTGYEIKYAILEGGVATPAVAIRGAYSKLDGIKDLDMSTTSADLSISKGFAMLTPYAGVGQVKIESEPTGALAAAGLTKESITETRTFVGVRLSLGIFMITAEYEQAEIPSYSARFSLGL